MGQVPKVGDLAPDFTLQQLEGDYVSLNDFRGKVVPHQFFWLYLKSLSRGGREDRADLAGF